MPAHEARVTRTPAAGYHPPRQSKLLSARNAVSPAGEPIALRATFAWTFVMVFSALTASSTLGSLQGSGNAAPIRDTGNAILAVSAATVETPVGEQGGASFGALLLRNRTDNDIELLAVRPVSVTRGVEELQLAVFYPWLSDDRALGVVDTFDPYLAPELVPVEGAVLTPGTKSASELQVIARIRLAEDSHAARIDGFLVRFRSGGVTYETRTEGQLGLYRGE